MFGIDTHYKIQQCYYEGWQHAVWHVDYSRTSSLFKFCSRLCSIKSTIIFQEKLDWTPSSNFYMFCRTFRCFYICIYMHMCIIKVTKSLLTCTPVARELSSFQNRVQISLTLKPACATRDPPQAATVSYQSLKCYSSRGENNMENDS